MLKGKVAIITGSTSGIGLGIAQVLAGQGVDIVLNGFGNTGEIETIRAGIEREHRVRAVYDPADMSKGEAVRGLIAATVERLGRIDIRSGPRHPDDLMTKCAQGAHQGKAHRTGDASNKDFMKGTPSRCERPGAVRSA